MEKIILILFALSARFFAYAQNESHFYFCSYGYGENNRGAEICKAGQSENFSSNIEAEKAVDKILAPLGLKRNFILVPCPKIKTCEAVWDSIDHLRYILYDNDFVENIVKSSKNDWTSLAILAHELGHHLNGHTLIRSDYSKAREDELEADEFSGFILFKLGASLSDAQAAIYQIFNPSCEQEIYYDHPCKEKRLDAIKNGWERAKEQQPESNGTTKEDTSLKVKVVLPCATNNTGDYCFENKSQYLITLFLTNSKGAEYLREISIYPGQTQCAYDLIVGVWEYSYRSFRGEIKVDPCKSQTLTFQH